MTRLFAPWLALSILLALSGCSDEANLDDDDDTTDPCDDDDVGDDDDDAGDDDTTDPCADDDDAQPSDLDGDGWSVDDGDCDDGNWSVYPGAEEGCDGLDTDCDGAVGAEELDDDGDGYSECDGDCDDADAARAPGVAELCNGVDDDCDGALSAEEALDADGDGVVNCEDCDDTDAASFPGAPELCDGLDNDCDGAVPGDEVDGDGDAYLACEDCDDGDAATYPGATELCDGLDNDCDGAVSGDEIDDDGDWLAECDGDCDDANIAVSPAAAEACNGIDDDCDGTIPAGEQVDGDGDGFLACAECDDCAAETFPGAPELCDGLDNDCDGNVNPSETDDDGDGLAECDGDCDDADAAVYPGAEEAWYDGVDSDCDGAEDPDPCDDPPTAAPGVDDPSCEHIPPVGDFDPVSEWGVTTFATYPTHDEIISTPMVGQMTDDNGDGVIDDLDVPDIAAIYRSRSDSYRGVVRLLSGDGTGEHWTAYEVESGYHPYYLGSLALADLDGDGWPEVLLTVYEGSDSFLACLNNDGTTRWVDTVNDYTRRGHYPATADMDGDGTVEIIYGASIYDADGTLRGQGAYGSGYNSSYSNSAYTSFAMDLDGDGLLEVVAGNALYDIDGNTICYTGDGDGYPGAADLDGDGLGEFVTVDDGTISLYEHDCTFIDSWSVTGGGDGGPPTIADYDGDGDPEIGLPGDDYYTVWETDGTVLWSQPIDDSSSHSTGSSVFDFDGDGQAEVVYADETRLWVYDGATGAVLLEYEDHRSGTVNEYPVIADADGDGRAEIVLANGDSGGGDENLGLRVIGDAEDNWVTTRQVWNQHAYSITNVNDDLSIPPAAAPNWPQFNSFRQAGIGTVAATAAPNLVPFLFEVCQEVCGDDVTFVVQVANEGALVAAAGVQLVLYADDGLGTLTALDYALLADDLDPGMLSEPVFLMATAAHVTGAATILVAVDDDGAGVGSYSECEEGDNEAVVDVSAVCP